MIAVSFVLFALLAGAWIVLPSPSTKAEVIDYIDMETDGAAVAA